MRRLSCSASSMTWMTRVRAVVALGAPLFPCNPPAPLVPRALPCVPWCARVVGRLLYCVALCCACVCLQTPSRTTASTTASACCSCSMSSAKTPCCDCRPRSCVPHTHKCEKPPCAASMCRAHTLYSQDLHVQLQHIIHCKWGGGKHGQGPAAKSSHKVQPLRQLVPDAPLGGYGRDLLGHWRQAVRLGAVQTWPAYIGVSQRQSAMQCAKNGEGNTATPTSSSPPTTTTGVSISRIATCRGSQPHVRVQLRAKDRVVVCRIGYPFNKH